MTTSQPTSGPSNTLCDLVELMAADMFPSADPHQVDEGTREIRSIVARDLLADLAGADAETVTFKDLAAGDEVYWDNLLRTVDAVTTVTIPPHAEFRGTRSTMARKMVRVTFVHARPAAARPTVELDYVPITRLLRT